MAGEMVDEDVSILCADIRDLMLALHGKLEQLEDLILPTEDDA